MANIKIPDLPLGSAIVGTEVFESVQSASSVKFTANQIKTFTSEAPTFVISDAVTNAAVTAATLQHTTSGSPANGIGVRLAFEVETSASNNEIGALIEAVATDTTATSEDFDIVFKTMTAGAAATESGRFTSNGDLLAAGGLFVGTTISTITNTSLPVYVNDATNTGISSVLTVAHLTSGTPGVGIGAAINYEIETATGNNEVGAQIAAVSTNVTSATEAFDLVVKLMTAGATAAEVARFTDVGNFSITGNTLKIADDRTITNANDTGVQGEICWDSSYIYVCTATDTWKRVAIATWP